ncbi:MAG: GGDEF domain-containing phosphodiesterase [Pseudomonadota bacterium]
MPKQQAREAGAADLGVAAMPGAAMLRQMDSDLVGALADAALDCSLILGGDGEVRWASTGFARRAGVSLVDLIGADLSLALGHLGRHDGPSIPEAEALDGEILSFERDEGQIEAYRCVVRALPGGDPAGGLQVLALFDVSTLMQQLRKAERARAAIEQRLNADVETGLPNERKLMEVLLRALRGEEAGEQPVGLLLVDVIEFGQIVDLYGTDVGNVVIQELVFELSDALAQGEGEPPFLARTKEHEFAIVFEQIGSTKNLIMQAEALVDRLSVEVSTELGECRASGLMSVALMNPGGGTPDQLLNNARIAMGFRDLPRRAGQVRLYEPEMRAALEARSRTYSELFTALARDEIEPFFQPQVRLSDRQVVGFEVLVRWRHPEQGLVPPGLFLEIAEETGLLPQIDDVVMRKAMRCLAEWHANGHAGARISLNCTGESLRDPAYVEKLMVELDRNGLSTRDVAIEILENVLFGDADDAARQTLQTLQTLGFYLEIDDFGTGQASISHLITLNADAVKLDRSLVRDIENNNANRLVVEATLALSRNLGLATLAEGTETESQMAVLQGLGCDYAQGFGIARPMPFEETTAWLERQAAATPQARSA